MTDALVTSRRWAALGLVFGPAVFIASWVVWGGRTAGYSPIDEAISRIAAEGAPHQAPMSWGFVLYGIGLVVGAAALRESPLARCAPAAVVNGLATVAVALTPLDRSSALDAWHGAAATLGYLAIIAMPLLASGPLRALGRSRGASLSVVVAVVSAACLAASAIVEANGLFQRAGLTAGDAWLITVGVTLWRNSTNRPVAPDGP